MTICPFVSTLWSLPWISHFVILISLFSRNIEKWNFPVASRTKNLKNQMKLILCFIQPTPIRILAFQQASHINLLLAQFTLFCELVFWNPVSVSCFQHTSFQLCVIPVLFVVLRDHLWLVAAILASAGIEVARVGSATGLTVHQMGNLGQLTNFAVLPLYHL